MLQGYGDNYNLLRNRNVPTATTWPSIAVVIPNHERIDTLSQALTSVARQHYCGTVRVYLVYRERPEIRPILEALGRDVVPVASPSEDGRNSIAVKRNAGIAAATEDLIAFLDDDDIWHPWKLRLQVDALRMSPSALAAGTRFTKFARVPRWREVPAAPRIRRLSRHTILRGGAIATSSLLATAQALHQIQFDERPAWRAVEDYDFKIRLHEAGPVCRVEARLTGYRVGEPSVSGTDRRHQYARALSVLAASVGPGRDGWLLRAAALELIPIAALAGGGALTSEAEECLLEALDGRLFGPLDPPLAAMIQKRWESPRISSVVRTFRHRLVPHHDRQPSNTNSE